MSKAVTRLKKATASSALVLVAGTSLGLTPANANDIAAGQAATAIVQNAAAAVLTGAAVTDYKASLTNDSSPITVTQYQNSARVQIKFVVPQMNPGDTIPVELADYLQLDQPVNQTLTSPTGEVIGTLVGAAGSKTLTFTAADNQYVKDSSRFEIESDMRLTGNPKTWGDDGTTRPITISVGGNAQDAGQMTYNRSKATPSTGGQLYVLSGTGEPDLGAKASLYPATADSVGKRLTQEWSFKNLVDGKDQTVFDKAWLEENGIDHILTYSSGLWGPNGYVANTDPAFGAAYAGKMRDGVSGANEAINPLQMKVESIDYENRTVKFSWVPQFEGQYFQMRLVKGNDENLKDTVPLPWYVDDTNGARHEMTILANRNGSLATGSEEVFGSPLLLTADAVKNQNEGPYFAMTTPVDMAGSSYNGLVGGQRGTYPFTGNWADALQKPTVVDDSFTTPYNTPVEFDTTINDSQAGYAVMDKDSAVFVATGTKTLTNEDGTYVIGAGGKTTFTPAPGRSGAVTPVEYRVFNDYGASAVGTITGTIGAPAAPKANPDALEIPFNGSGSTSLTGNDTANGQGNSIKADTATWEDGSKSKTVDGITFTIAADGSVTVEAAGSNHAGTYELPYTVQDAFGTETSSTFTVKVAEPTIKVGLKTLVAGQDANDPNSPVTLAPGEHEVTYQITNPNPYQLDAASLALANGSTAVDLPEDLVIPAGGTVEVKSKVTVPKQGKIDVAGKVTGSYSYTLNGEAKTITADAADPAYAKAPDYKVTLKAEIDGHDANTVEDAYKITIPHDQQTIDKRILLPFTNPGTEPITVTGFKDQAGTTYTLDEPITLAGGEAGEFYADYRFTPGTHELNFEVITEEGVTAMDPVVVVVEQEEAPAPAPAPSEEPKVEQEKPAEPAAPAEQPKVEQAKPAAPAPIVPETGAGYTVEAGEGVELVAAGDTASAPASSGLLGLLGGLLGGVLGALGFQAYNRKKNQG